jgi:hypothetical protein
MAVVRNIKEKVHLPIYDCIKVKPGEQLSKENGNSSTLKFFVDVQGKTKLETNLQSASLLPHYNTFEARAMRVVISDLPPVFSDEETATLDADVTVTDQAGNDVPIRVDNNGIVVAAPAGNPVSATIEVSLDRLGDLLLRARHNDGSVDVPVDDNDVTLQANNQDLNDATVGRIGDAGGTITLSTEDIEAAFDDLDDAVRPPDVQIRPSNGTGNLIGKLVYNSVTSLYVGEKVMIEMPTWFFPSGAGPYSETANITTHGEPSPTSTFRFAEPIFVDKQQNFRVEIDVPDSDVFKEFKRLYGPLFIWVVLDGYMTRDVQ